jgi:hypothetical protein
MHQAVTSIPAARKHHVLGEARPVDHQHHHQLGIMLWRSLRSTSSCPERFV